MNDTSDKNNPQNREFLAETGVYGNAFKHTGEAKSHPTLDHQMRETLIARVRKQIRDAAEAVKQDNMSPEDARAAIANIFSAASSMFPDGIPIRVIESVNRRLASVSDEKAKDNMQAASAKITQENDYDPRQNTMDEDELLGGNNSADPLSQLFAYTVNENDKQAINEEKTPVIDAISSFISAVTQHDTIAKSTAFGVSEADKQTQACHTHSATQDQCDGIKKECEASKGNENLAQQQMNRTQNDKSTLSH